RQHHIPKDVEGVVVTKVASDSPAASLGIEAGDVIMSIDQQPVKTPQEASEQLKQAAANGNILLLLNRRGTTQFVGLSVSPGTGLEPFGGASVPPALEAASRLPPRLGALEIATASLPSVFGRALAALEDALVAARPDIVFCVGQAGGRAELSLERVAINVDDA